MSNDGDTLRLIPRDVRDKLDMISVKLHLRDWQQLTQQQREQLQAQPCATAHERAQFAALLREVLGRDLEPLSGSSKREG